MDEIQFTPGEHEPDDEWPGDWFSALEDRE